MDENGKTKPFHEFVKLSDTRWLVQYFVVNNLLEHWLELQTHFHAVIAKEKCYTARLLDQMLSDNVNFLYLTFLRPILYEVNRLNKIFQTDSIDLGLAVEDLSALILLIARKIVKPSFLNYKIQDLLKEHDNELAYLQLEEVNFGIEYYQALEKSGISKEQKIDLETRAFSFLKRLFCEMAARLPENFKLFEGLKAFSPHVCLNQIRPKFKDLPLINELIDKSKQGLVETQCNKLLTIKWNNHLDQSILKKPQTFWPQVYSFEDEFSCMKLVKSKLRNKMGLPMLDALLRIRCRFHATKTCCTVFLPTREMFEKFNYKVVYPANYNNNDEEGQINNEVFEALDEIVTISISEF